MGTLDYRAGNLLEASADMNLTDRIFRYSDQINRRIPAIGQVVEGIHLLQAGPTGDLPLVLIHGASGNLRDWQSSIFDHLAQRHHVIAMDRPGFGHSGALPGYGTQLVDQVTAMRRVLTTLGHQRYVLVGHSYGGSIAMRWVLDHPDEVAGVLALSAPMLDWGGTGIGLHYKIGGRPVLGDILCRLVPILAGPVYVRSAITDVFAPQSPPPDYVDAGGVELALRPATFRVNAAMMLALYPQIVAQAAGYDAITCPLEFVHGDADTIVPAQIHAIPLAERLPHAELTMLPGIGHMPHHAAPDPVIQAIDRMAAAAAEPGQQGTRIA